MSMHPLGAMLVVKFVKMSTIENIVIGLACKEVSLLLLFLKEVLV